MGGIIPRHVTRLATANAAVARIRRQGVFAGCGSSPTTAGPKLIQLGFNLFRRHLAFPISSRNSTGTKKRHHLISQAVPSLLGRAGIEPATHGFSVPKNSRFLPQKPHFKDMSIPGNTPRIKGVLCPTQALTRTARGVSPLHGGEAIYISNRKDCFRLGEGNVGSGRRPSGSDVVGRQPIVVLLNVALDDSHCW